MKCYGIGENKCLTEVYSKDDQDNLIVTVKVSFNGIGGTSTQKDILYPDGFGRDNCYVVGLAYKLQSESYKRTDLYDPYGGAKYLPFANLGGNTMRVGMAIFQSGMYSSDDDPIDVFVTLAKTKTIDGTVTS